jgi:hypothetical protein
LPTTAKVASGPLQRISEAVSNILTPKTAKIPQIPALTESPPTYDFNPFFRDDKNFTYEKSSTAEFEPSTTESVTKSRQQNSSPTNYKIDQNYNENTQS